MCSKIVHNHFLLYICSVNFILEDEKQNMTIENGEYNFIHHINYW